MVFGSGRKKKKEAAEKSKKKAAGTKEQKIAASQNEAEIGEPSIEIKSAPDSTEPTPVRNNAAQQAGDSGQVVATTVAGPPPEEIFVDGISSLYFRSGVVKLDCYRVVGHDQKENKEIRMASHRLVMPTMSLQELIRLLQNASNMQRSQADKAE